MADRPDPATGKPTPDRRRGRLVVWLVAANLAIFLLMAYGVLSVTGRPLPMPGWMSDRAAAKLGEAVAPASVGIGGVELLVGPDGVPAIVLRDVTLRDDGGAEVVRLNDLRARLSPAALVSGQAAPETIRLSGAQVTMRRSADGRFALSFGSGNRPASSVSEVLARIEAALAAGPLAGIEAVEARDLTITLEDARSGRIWQAPNAAVTLTRRDGAIAITMASELFNGTENLARVQMSFRSEPGGGASIGAEVEGMPAGDVALQSPALSFLGLLAAPIDGSLRATFTSDGRLDGFAASLEIREGAIQPAPNAVLAVSDGRASLTYDPATQRIAFGEISLVAEGIDLAGSGHAYLRDLEDGWPQRLVGQFQLDHAGIARDDLLADPVRFDGGAADINLRLDPFEIDIGQIVLTQGSGDDRRDLRARGSVSVTPDGWRAAIDASAERLTPDEVLALWPLHAIPNTRRWIVENVRGGEATGIVGALRLEPGERPRASVSYAFDDAEVRFLKFFPLITGGQGRATLENNAYTMVLNDGVVPAPSGTIALGGSVFHIDDVTQKPQKAEIELHTQGPVRAALELLNNRPFEILDKSGFDPSLVSAEGRAVSRISFDLIKNVPKDSVVFETTGTLSDVTLSGLRGAPSPMEAETLDLSVTRERMEIRTALPSRGSRSTGAGSSRLVPRRRGQPGGGDDLRCPPTALPR